jgi:hypothetical protein
VSELSDTAPATEIVVRAGLPCDGSCESEVTQDVCMYAHLHVGSPPPSRCGYIVYRDLTISLGNCPFVSPACLKQAKE